MCRSILINAFCSRLFLYGWLACDMATARVHLIVIMPFCTLHLQRMCRRMHNAIPHTLASSRYTQLTQRRGPFSKYTYSQRISNLNSCRDLSVRFAQILEEILEIRIVNAGNFV